MEDITVYTCKDGRTRAYVKSTKKVVSYPKLLMEEKIGRKLEHNEEVHHIDGDPLNNDLSNLEIRLHGEHQKEHGTKYFDKEIECTWCGKTFVWTGVQQRYHYGNFGRAECSKEMLGKPFCSKKCIGEYGRKIQLDK